MSTDSQLLEAPNADLANGGIEAEDNRFGYEPVPEADGNTEKIPEYATGSNDDEAEESDAVADESAAAGEEKGKKPEGEKPLSRSDWADYGLTEDEAKALEAKGDLASTLDLMDRRFAAMGKQGAGEKIEPTTGEAAKPAEGPFKIEMDKEYFDERLVAHMTSIVDYVNTLHGKLEQLGSSAQRTRLDAYFNSLGDGYADVFGKGPLDALPSDSPARKLRLEVESTARALAAGYSQVGQAVPEDKVLWERAVRVAAGDRVQELARKEVADKVRDARGQFVAKPTHREGKPFSRRERAVQFADTFYKRKGLVD